MRRGEYSFDAYRVVLRQRRFPGLVPLFDRAGGRDDRRRRPHRRADRLLGAAAPAAAARTRRVHHPVAAGHPGDRAGVRLHQALRQLLDPAADRDLARRRRVVDVRLCRSRPALHVPLGRDGAALDRRAHADGSGRKPGRGRRSRSCSTSSCPTSAPASCRARSSPSPSSSASSPSPACWIAPRSAPICS